MFDAYYRICAHEMSLAVLSTSAVTGARGRGLGHIRVHSLGTQK